MYREKILIIDAEIFILSSLKEYLELEGYHNIVVAEGGVDGLRLANDEHPDLILLDEKMPFMDGYEVLQEIKKRRIPTRVIMMTHLAPPPDNIINFKSLGACDYIMKPFEREKLIKIIEQAFIKPWTMNLNIIDNPNSFHQALLHSSLY
jgi:two-component system alkaline phosphatase synthesis response regulator PhoP